MAGLFHCWESRQNIMACFWNILLLQQLSQNQYDHLIMVIIMSFWVVRQWRGFKIVLLTCCQGAQTRLAINKVCFLFIPAQAECQRFGRPGQLDFFALYVQSAILYIGGIYIKETFEKVLYTKMGQNILSGWSQTIWLLHEWIGKGRNEHHRELKQINFMQLPWKKHIQALLAIYS